MDLLKTRLSEDRAGG